MENRSLLSLLKKPNVERPDRTLGHPIGRWARAKAAESMSGGCAIQNPRFTLANNERPHDLKKDSGETRNLMAGLLQRMNPNQLISKSKKAATLEE